jgi:hypothetical protein
VVAVTIERVGHLFVAGCPLGSCHWLSDPLENTVAVQEAFRAHLAGHPHAALVKHIHASGMTITEYERKPE